MWTARFCLICCSFQWGNILNHEGFPPGYSTGINVAPNKVLFQAISHFFPICEKEYRDWIKKPQNEGTRSPVKCRVWQQTSWVSISSLPNNSAVFFNNKKIHFFVCLFILAVLGSPRVGFLYSQWVGAALSRGERASHCGGFSCCGAQSLGWGSSIAVAPGLVAPRHMGSSQTRDRTSVRCIGRRIINHWTIRDTLVLSLKYIHQWPHLYLLASSQ